MEQSFTILRHQTITAGQYVFIAGTFVAYTNTFILHIPELRPVESITAMSICLCVCVCGSVCQGPTKRQSRNLRQRKNKIYILSLLTCIVTLGIYFVLQVFELFLIYITVTVTLHVCPPAQQNYYFF